MFYVCIHRESLQVCHMICFIRCDWRPGLLNDYLLWDSLIIELATPLALVIIWICFTWKLLLGLVSCAVLKLVVCILTLKGLFMSLAISSSLVTEKLVCCLISLLKSFSRAYYYGERPRNLPSRCGEMPFSIWSIEACFGWVFADAFVAELTIAEFDTSLDFYID